MKEQNLLVFRDYKVKLGDFGISIKLKPDTEPDEKIYELKGLTKGYTLKKLEQSFTDDCGDCFSKNELYSNDYFALFQTFNNIK